jgi:hypothetical protein
VALSCSPKRSVGPKIRRWTAGIHVLRFEPVQRMHHEHRDPVLRVRFNPENFVRQLLAQRVNQPHCQASSIQGFPQCKMAFGFQGQSRGLHPANGPNFGQVGIQQPETIKCVQLRLNRRVQRQIDYVR